MNEVKPETYQQTEKACTGKYSRGTGYILCQHRENAYLGTSDDMVAYRVHPDLGVCMVNQLKELIQWSIVWVWAWCGRKMFGYPIMVTQTNGLNEVISLTFTEDPKYAKKVMAIDKLYSEIIVE